MAPAPAPSSPAPSPTYAGPGMSASEAAILKKVAPGLVIINTTLQYNAEQAAGTGMVISAGGRVLTNNHVIENATKISATVLATGRTYPVTVVGYDVTGDIALLQMQGASGLHPVPTGDSAKVKTGDPVVAMGNAQGQSEIVPAAGQVTGVNQTITANDQGGTISSETLHGMIETNANVVSGDSGGPLANSAGEVIGMDTAGDDVGYSSSKRPPVSRSRSTRPWPSPIRSPRGRPVPPSPSVTRPSSGSTSARDPAVARRLRPRRSSRTRTAGSATSPVSATRATAQAPAAQVPAVQAPGAATPVATPATPTWPCRPRSPR